VSKEDLRERRSYPSVLVLRREVSGYLDKRGEVRNLRHEVRAEVHDLLEKELALLVDFTAFLCPSCQLNQGIIDATVIERLKQEGHIVVKKILIEVDNVGAKADTATSQRVEVTACDIDRDVEDVNESVEYSKLLVHMDRLGQRVYQARETEGTAG